MTLSAWSRPTWRHRERGSGDSGKQSHALFATLERHPLSWWPQSRPKALSLLSGSRRCGAALAGLVIWTSVGLFRLQLLGAATRSCLAGFVAVLSIAAC